MALGAAVWAMAASAVCAAEAPAPGRETPVAVQGAADVVLWLPSNYDAARTWPAVFFYHGQGGHPTVEPLKRITGGNDYLLVGMSYVDPEPKPRTPAQHDAYVRAELDHLHAAQARVAAVAKIDPRRVHLGGSSMGGWTATMLGERDMPKLAGMIVLLAGRLRNTAFPTVPFRGKPVYLGAGETDPNLSAARRAAALYRSLGAQVTLEEFPGVGHATPPDAPALRAWMDARGRLADAGAGARDELKTWMAGVLSRVDAEQDPAQRYLGLRAAWDDPRFPLCDAAAGDEIRRRAAPLTDLPAVRAERTAAETLDRLLIADLKVRRLEEMREVRDGLKALADTHGATRAGRIAAGEFRRTDEAYRASVEATRKASRRTP